MSEPVLDAATSRHVFDVTKIIPEYIINFSTPSDGVAFIDGSVQKIELFIPTNLYQTNYKSLTQFNKAKFPNFAKRYIDLIELFCYISSSMVTFIVDKDHNKIRTHKVLMEVVREKSDLDNEIVDLLESGDTTADSIKEYINQETFAAQRKKLNVVGIRLRIVITAVNKYTFGTIIQSIINRNEVRGPLKVLTGGDKKGKNASATGRRLPLFPEIMTMEMYVSLCKWYTGSTEKDGNNVDLTLSLWDQNNPMNPCRVFSLDNSMVRAERSGGDIVSHTIGCYEMVTSEEQKISTPIDPIQIKRKKTRRGAGGGGGGGGGDGDEDEEGEPQFANRDEVDNEMNDEGLDGGNNNNNRKKKDTVELVFIQTINHYPYYDDVYEIGSHCVNPYEISKYILPHRRNFGYDNEKDIFA
jgi:hypothetical protein